MEWIPNSEYDLDNKPDFEILVEKYKNGNPTSKEEIMDIHKTDTMITALYQMLKFSFLIFLTLIYL